MPIDARPSDGRHHTARVSRGRPALLMLALSSSLLALFAPGCRSTAIGQGPVYPAAASRGETLDVHLLRRGTRMRLTNTTAREFSAGTLWLNGWYGRAIPALSVGETLDLSLREFRDEYGTPFRAGGFFAREKPEKVVLAEFQSGDRLLSLVVIDQTDE